MDIWPYPISAAELRPAGTGDLARTLSNARRGFDAAGGYRLL